jgi:hypothetical protein
MEAVIRVLLVLVSCCNWITMELLDPQGGYLSVWRIAELADLPFHLVAPRDDDPKPRRRRMRLDCVERVLRVLRTAHIVVYTQQHRDELPDGRHTSTAPALRKLAVSFFLKFGGRIAQLFRRRRADLKERADSHERNTFRAGVGVDLRNAAEMKKLPAPGEAVGAPLPAPTRLVTATSMRWSQAPEHITDTVYAEHPDWSLGNILAEARRRHHADGLHGQHQARERDPPGGSSSEPST